jgi:hypothetical protein
MNFSLKQIISFILANHVTPSGICEAMGNHYRDNADEEAQKLIGEQRGLNYNVGRWTEIANTCDAAAKLFKKINI